MAQGRKGKLTAELQKEICEVLAAGNYAETACAYVGVSTQTYYNWIKWGEEALANKRGVTKNKKKYVDFLDAVEKATAKPIVRNVALINKAGETQWQAAAWWLERRKPGLFGRQKLDISIEKTDSDLDAILKEQGIDGFEALADIIEIAKSVKEQ